VKLNEVRVVVAGQLDELAVIVDFENDERIAAAIELSELCAAGEIPNGAQVVVSAIKVFHGRAHFQGGENVVVGAVEVCQRIVGGQVETGQCIMAATEPLQRLRQVLQFTDIIIIALHARQLGVLAHVEAGQLVADAIEGKQFGEMLYALQVLNLLISDMDFLHIVDLRAAEEVVAITLTILLHIRTEIGVGEILLVDRYIVIYKCKILIVSIPV